MKKYMITSYKKQLLFGILLLSLQLVTAQKLVLTYNKPAQKWTEALPLGNGLMGAMVFGGVNEDRIQFNEATLWTGEPRNYNKTGAYKYLDTIRTLLFAGKQKEAETIAEKEFLGTKSDEGKTAEWVKNMLSLKGLSGNPALESFDDSKWKTIKVPSFEGWEAAGLEGLDGAVWLRTSFLIDSRMLTGQLVLDLNRIRDYDLTYINGKLIGTQQNSEARKYIIPNNVLHTGKNIIAIQVLNFFDKGGVAGYKDTSRHIGIYSAGNEAKKISLNGQWKYLIQNDEPPAVGVYQASYQPFGDLLLQFNHAENATNYKRTLDISNAVATTSYSLNGINFKRDYFISQPNKTMAIHLTATHKRSISCSVSLNSPHKNFTINKIDSNTISMSVKVRNGALYGVSYLQIKIAKGSLQISNNKIIIANADEADLYLTAATNFKNYEDVSANPATAGIKILKSIANKTYQQIATAHIKEYQQYFNTYSISFSNKKSIEADPYNAIKNLNTDERLDKFPVSNDPSFVALYQQYGRYLLIASSRPGAQPANLQGIWNDLLTPPWGSKYTTNINAEMNYWPAELLNLSALHQPLFGMIEELSKSGRTTAKEYYNSPGWVLHHNTDIWRGTAPINAANHGIWVTGGAWMCQHLWDHYLFTLDKAFLKNNAYPIMKEAALFFRSFLIKDPATGYLISSPSNSPEQGGLVGGPTMDHQIIRDLFKNVIAASQVLKLDEELRKSLQQKLLQIAPNKIGKYGQLQEWMQDVDDTTNKHRHISHLWGMYPGNEINYEDDPSMMKAAQQSLLYRGDAATGWSLGWKINCWARFKDGNHTFKMINMLMTPAKAGAGSYPNLFDAHPPFQIDGNFGGAAGIGEMLIQSHTKFIDILPALPDALSNGNVKGICARGGFVIDMQWSDGKLLQIKVLSKAGMPLVLRYNGIIKNITTVKNGLYQFNSSLKKI